MTPEALTSLFTSIALFALLVSNFFTARRITYLEKRIEMLERSQLRHALAAFLATSRDPR